MDCSPLSEHTRNVSVGPKLLNILLLTWKDVGGGGALIGAVVGLHDIRRISTLLIWDGCR